MKFSQKSFTLLELLVVIAIIAILAGVVIASVVDLRQRAKESKGMQFSQNIRTTLSNELTGEWKLDEINGGIVKDTSDEGRDGTLMPIATPPQLVEDAKIGKALELDGTEDYINFSGKGLNDPFLYGGVVNGKMSFEAWIKPTRTSGINYDTIARRIGGFHYFSIQSNTNPVLILMVSEVDSNGNQTKNYWPNSNSKVKIGDWNHVVFVLEGRIGCKFYINGNLDRTISNTNLGLFNYGSDSAIGATLGGTATYFKGMVDEVRIYKSAITAEEVKKRYAQGKLLHLAEN